VKALLIHGQMSKYKSLAPLYICVVMEVASRLISLICIRLSL
jgi:hypothetical protein